MLGINKDPSLDNDAKSWFASTLWNCLTGEIASENHPETRRALTKAMVHFGRHLMAIKYGDATTSGDDGEQQMGTSGDAANAKEE